MIGMTTLKKQTVTGVRVKNMTTAAFFIAMVTLFTAYIFHIPVGVNGGYIHLGDTVIYLAASIFPTSYACAIAAIGGGLADLLTAPVWAPATIIIKILICFSFSSKRNKIVTKRNLLALSVAFVITVVGYFVAEGFLFGFTGALFLSAGSNCIQAAGSAVMFLVAGNALDRIKFKIRFGIQ